MSETDQATGTLIRVNHGAREMWHHSVEFDGYEHETACGQSFECHEVNCVLLEISAWGDIYKQRCCDECAGSVRSLSPGGERDAE